MNVLITYQGFGGVQRHRLHDPFQNLHASGAGVNVQHTPSLDGIREEDWKQLEQFDVVVFNRNISPVMDPRPVFDMLRSMNIKIVIDIDDYWEIPKYHVANEWYKLTNVAEAMKVQMLNADQVWVTNKHLGSYVEEFNKDWRVIPNAIDPAMFPAEGNEYTDKVFYQGSVTHRRDLELIKDMDITVCGYVEKDAEWEKIRKMMPNAHMEDARDAMVYHELYFDKGVCVIPLKQNKFNRAKSNLKMLEAGYYQKAVVVTNTHPYTPFARDNQNCLLVKDGDYESRLKGLLKSRQWQDDLRFQLHEDVMSKHHMKIVNASRLSALCELYNDRHNGKTKTKTWRPTRASKKKTKALKAAWDRAVARAKEGS